MLSNNGYSHISICTVELLLSKAGKPCFIVKQPLQQIGVRQPAKRDINEGLHALETEVTPHLDQRSVSSKKSLLDGSGRGLFSHWDTTDKSSGEVQRVNTVWSFILITRINDGQSLRWELLKDIFHWTPGSFLDRYRHRRSALGW